MKTIISKIIEESDLKIITLDTNVDFAYYDEKDDFFLFLFYNKNQLIELNNNEVVDLEYTINRIIIDFKNNENLSKFRERNIDHNLSLVLLLELENEDIELQNELNKVEENSLNAKKYVLPYIKSDIEILSQKLDGTNEVVNRLNEIAVENSNLLGKVIDGWYKTLMGFFIKLPFLNYQSTEDNQSLENLSLKIEESLSVREKQLLSVISENDFNNFPNIEDFITQFNLTNEANDEI
jgi:3-methyladenine DNA glycosylase AlkC